MPRKITHSSPQQGFSLIELMIALVLGLFVIAGLATVYLSSKETYALRDQISEMDENARIAIKALRTHIEGAGYSSEIGSIQLDNYLLPAGFVVSTATCPNGNTNVINPSKIASSADGAALGSAVLTTNAIMARADSIGVSFLADDQNFKDCTGSSWKNRCMVDPTASLSDWANQSSQAQTTRRVYSSFKIQKNASRNNSIGEGIPELVCGGSLNSLVQPWAQGIEHMQLRYGVDILPDPVPIGQRKQWQVDQYWSATEVTANNAWDQVALVQLALLVRTIDPVFKQAETETHQLFDQQIKTSDRYKRSVYTTTIYLRNITR